MVDVVEVKTNKQKRQFIEFPLRLYKECPYFVPPLYGDEKKIFRADYMYYDQCEAVYYLAYRDGVPVGRISGILQRASNEKTGQKRVRFTRFDSIDDTEVAGSLFGAVESWALSRGMDTVCGPLGFSDLEREGLLIEGFDQKSTFEEQYNYEYYQRLIEDCGYGKEVDWNESRIYLPDEPDDRLEKSAALLMKRYNLKPGPAKNINEFLKKYADKFFDLLDRSYDKIYGTVPFTDSMKKSLISGFKLLLDVEHVAVVVDENDKPVLLGLCFPSISEAVRKSNGRLTPAAIIRILRAKAHPKVLDLGLVGVDPEYENKGVGAIASAAIMRMLKADGIEYAETNLNLEDNYQIQNMWKRFKRVIHKRRRSYVKKLTENNKE
ncbi:MAG: GNAT family N-acetyltransferase [Clostridia bacterium]|nr:GNAT family N-acetyltransferase [Clostridia bacterium]MBQ3869700.1 GNAT family N-acetyltransferase [Clostridia bacterium]